MIQIDDAAWGCPIGPVLIGALRLETEEYVFEPVPVELFQGAAFERQDYLEGARQATERCLEQLGHTGEEPLEICTGYVHAHTRLWFARRGLPWRTTKIEGALQDRIEASSREVLNGLGFDYRASTEAYGKLFHAAIVWLKGGDPDARAMVPGRLALAKTGWRTFPCYRDLPYAEAVLTAKRLKASRHRGRLRGRYDDES